jgi:hypothetical protein
MMSLTFLVTKTTSSPRSLYSVNATGHHFSV